MRSEKVRFRFDATKKTYHERKTFIDGLFDRPGFLTILALWSMLGLKN